MELSQAVNCMGLSQKDEIVVLLRNLLSAAMMVVMSGCAAGWIANPSPQTRALVDDLKLEGFACSAHFSSIECLQKEPLRNKQPSLCDSAKGCVKQPDHLIFNRYIITQDSSGVPGIQHDLLRKVDSKPF